MTDQETGSLERPLAAGEWFAPAVVELVGDLLVWQWGDYRNTPRVRSGDRMLADFAALAQGRPERIRAYAGKWGVLGIDGFGEWGGVPEYLPRRAGGFPPPLWTHHPSGGAEPLEVWRRYAKRARALLRVAAALHAGERADDSDWEDCFPPGYLGNAPPGYETPGRWGLSGGISLWLGESGAGGLRMTWFDGVTPSIGLQLGETPLLAALGFQLMFAAARSSGLAICSNCATAYFPRRPPRAGERRYCDPCREAKVPGRDAARDARIRTRAKASTATRVDGNVDGNR